MKNNLVFVNKTKWAVFLQLNVLNVDVHKITTIQKIAVKETAEEIMYGYLQPITYTPVYYPVPTVVRAEVLTVTVYISGKRSIVHVDR